MAALHKTKLKASKNSAASLSHTHTHIFKRTAKQLQSALCTPQGAWQADRPHGEGILSVHIGGLVYQGQFEDGRPMQVSAAKRGQVVMLEHLKGP